jgi:hypothetical protein
MRIAPFANDGQWVSVDWMHAAWSEAERSRRLTSAFGAAIALNAEFKGHSTKLKSLKDQSSAIRQAYWPSMEHGVMPQKVAMPGGFNHELRLIWLSRNDERPTDLLPWYVAWRKHQRVAPERGVNSGVSWSVVITPSVRRHFAEKGDPLPIGPPTPASLWRDQMGRG